MLNQNIKDSLNIPHDIDFFPWGEFSMEPHSHKSLTLPGELYPIVYGCVAPWLYYFIFKYGRDEVLDTFRTLSRKLQLETAMHITYRGSWKTRKQSYLFRMKSKD